MLNIGFFQKIGVSKRLLSALDTCQEGIGLFRKDGKMEYCNKVYQHYNLPDSLKILYASRHPETGIVRMDTPFQIPASLKVSDFGDYFVIIITPYSHRLWHREKVLSYLADGKQGGQDIFTMTAQAIGRTLPWRWIGVSRFLDNEGKHVRILGWWDKDTLQPGFDLQTAGTPCETVARTGEFCFYGGSEQLHYFFHDWPLLEKLKLTAYAGLIYRVNGKAVGHIIAMHDGPEMDGELTGDILQIATHFVGTNLELEKARDELIIARDEARQDKLTGLRNHLALKEEFSLISHLYTSGNITDAAIIMCDLDNLKVINDQQGHETGNRMIMAFAAILRKTWRQDDGLFRYGGDEFVIVVRNVGPVYQDEIKRSLTICHQELQAAFPESGSSFGYSFLSEHHGNTNDALASADSRMYQQKSEKPHRKPVLLRQMAG